VIPALERLDAPSHPKHRTRIQGIREMNVTGDPVYAGAFVRRLHETAAEYDPQLPLEMALDFGKHHPCVVFRQPRSSAKSGFSEASSGSSCTWDDFIDIVLKYRATWFPNPVQIRECCDPAGASATSHGTTLRGPRARARGFSRSITAGGRRQGSQLSHASW
jgi:hypothetical protein